jgi:hypothetical protein
LYINKVLVGLYENGFIQKYPDDLIVGLAGIIEEILSSEEYDEIFPGRHSINRDFIKKTAKWISKIRFGLLAFLKEDNDIEIIEKDLGILVNRFLPLFIRM